MECCAINNFIADHDSFHFIVIKKYYIKILRGEHLVKEAKSPVKAPHSQVVMHIGVPALSAGSVLILASWQNGCWLMDLIACLPDGSHRLSSDLMPAAWSRICHPRHLGSEPGDGRFHPLCFWFPKKVKINKRTKLFRKKMIL